MGGQQVGALDEAGSTSLGATGTGQVAITPPGNERWRISHVAVSTNQAASVTTIPTCHLYRGSVNPGNLVDATYTGSQDATDLDLWFEKGTPIIAVWAGGPTTGVTATLSIFGERWSY